MEFDMDEEMAEKWVELKAEKWVVVTVGVKVASRVVAMAVVWVDLLADDLAGEKGPQSGLW